MNNSVWEKRRKRLFELIEIGSNYDAWCWGYDFFNTFTILLNLAVSIMYTFDNMELKYGPLLLTLERLTVAFFAIDFLLRVFTAKYLYPDVSEPRAIWKYLTSFSGIVDMLSFIPYYMPFFFPSGAVAFRMLRIIRIFRLFRINAYYDSLNVITEVIVGKKQQLLSSVFIILILMISSSLCMYSLENKAQPEVFTNAFSGIWWAASTLLTVGYGDIYPVTTMGKIFGIFIAFLGVGMVAIPTGIISAGFVEQYTKLKTLAYHSEEHELKFVTSTLQQGHSWNHKAVKEIVFPPQLMLIMILRKGEVLVPNGNTVLECGDNLVIAAKDYRGDEDINLKEVLIKEENEWVGRQIKDLDMSRQELIVMIKRKRRTFIPNGSTYIKEGDVLVIYSHVAEN